MCALRSQTNWFDSIMTILTVHTTTCFVLPNARCAFCPIRILIENDFNRITISCSTERAHDYENWSTHGQYSLFSILYTYTLHMRRTHMCIYMLRWLYELHCIHKPHRHLHYIVMNICCSLRCAESRERRALGLWHYSLSITPINLFKKIQCKKTDCQFNDEIADSLIECDHIRTDVLVVGCVFSDTVIGTLVILLFHVLSWFNHNQRNMV